MRAEEIGRHLLMQTKITWDERELEYTTVSAGIYWLAQLLRSSTLKDRDISLRGENVSLPEIADAVERIPEIQIPSDYRSVMRGGILILRMQSESRIDLRQEYTDILFPPPL